MLFGNKARICRELRLLQRGLHINITLEELLADMAKERNVKKSGSLQGYLVWQKGMVEAAGYYFQYGAVDRQAD